jgi:hypothetical protein
MTDISTTKGTETDLGLLIKNISQRPEMYTGSSDLTIVAAFIEGFAYAIPEFEDEIKEFNYWLPIRLKFPRNWAWWAGLAKIFPNNEDAFRELPILFDEFRKSR